MSNHRKYCKRCDLAAAVACASAILLAGLSPAAADEPPIQATALLPRDLSPWGMFMNADVVVKAVMIGLVIASVVTWTVWLAKTIELLRARRQVRSAMSALGSIQTLGERQAIQPQGTGCELLCAPRSRSCACPMGPWTRTA